MPAVVACLLVVGQQPKFLRFPVRFRLEFFVGDIFLFLLFFLFFLFRVTLLVGTKLRSDPFVFLLLSLVDLVLFLSLAVEDFLLDSLGFLFD